MKATKRLIDSVWTIEYNVISENEVEITHFSRTDEEGYRRERELPQGVIIEAEHRTAVELIVRDKFDSFEWVNKDNADHIYKIINPKHIFDY